MSVEKISGEDLCAIQNALKKLDLIAEKKAMPKDFDLDGCYRKATINDASEYAKEASKRLLPVFRKILEIYQAQEDQQ